MWAVRIQKRNRRYKRNQPKNEDQMENAQKRTYSDKNTQKRIEIKLKESWNKKII